MIRVYRLFISLLALCHLKTVSAQEIIITNDLSLPNLMQIPKCNIIAQAILAQTIARCNITLIIHEYATWIDDYTQNVCNNPTCFNIPDSAVDDIKNTCPEQYVASLNLTAEGSLFKISANPHNWITRIDAETVNRIPACTRDITNEFCLPKIAHELATLNKPRKEVVCSRCARLMAHSMLKSSSLPLYSGLTLSNPHAYKVDDVYIWDYMNNECGEEFMMGLNAYQNSFGYWEVWPKIYLMVGIGAGFYIYRYGYSFRLNWPSKS